MAGRELVQVPAQIVDFKPKADRSWRLTFGTRELSGEEVKVLADNFQGEGWLVFSPNGEIAPDDVPLELADAGVKSPAQRLRAVIYLLWKQKGSKGDFESYYRTSMEKLVEYISVQLDES